MCNIEIICYGNVIFFEIKFIQTKTWESLIEYKLYSKRYG